MTDFAKSNSMTRMCNTACERENVIPAQAGTSQ